MRCSDFFANGSCRTRPCPPAVKDLEAILVLMLAQEKKDPRKTFGAPPFCSCEGCYRIKMRMSGAEDMGSKKR